MSSPGSNPAIGQPMPTTRTERRRRPRRKPRLPAYASLHSPQASSDLCEIVDLSEAGMAIQTVSPLKVGDQQGFSVEVSSTNASVELSGTVAWAASGRSGIQFIDPPASALGSLLDAKNGVQGQSPDGREDERFESSIGDGDDRTALLVALAAVAKEVESLGNDLDAVLHLIARRAQAFTGANAAAIGLSDGEELICRATAGASAPVAGARLRIGAGFSGECVRSGLLLRCYDAEIDPRVDRDSCRALGIRSMIAAPIRSHGVVIGLLEVFAPHPNIFRDNHELAVHRFTELVSAAVRRAGLSGSATTAPARGDDEFPLETSEDLPLPGFGPTKNLLKLSAGMAVILAVLWTVQHWSTPEPVMPVATPVTSGENRHPAPAEEKQTLQQLAENGDPAAQFSIAMLYWTGDHVAQDYGQAEHWFSLAADRGNVAAQAMLGDCYWSGRGAPVDAEQAYFWSFVAQAGGDGTSKSRLELVATRLQPAQITRLQRQANDWMAEHARAPSPAPQQ